MQRGLGLGAPVDRRRHEGSRPAEGASTRISCRAASKSGAAKHPWRMETQSKQQKTKDGARKRRRAHVCPADAESTAPSACLLVWVGKWGASMTSPPTEWGLLAGKTWVPSQGHWGACQLLGGGQISWHEMVDDSILRQRKSGTQCSEVCTSRATSKALEYCACEERRIPHRISLTWRFLLRIVQNSASEQGYHQQFPQTERKEQQGESKGPRKGAWTRTWTHNVLAMFAAAAAGWLSFTPALDGEFIFDDFGAIVENRDVTGGAPLRALLGNDFWGNPMNVSAHKSYRPLTVLSFRLNFEASGGRLDPHAFHATNNALHAAASALVVPVAALWLFPTEAGPIPVAATALLFATHPVHTEAVAGAFPPIPRPPLPAPYAALQSARRLERMRIAAAVIHKRLFRISIYLLSRSSFPPHAGLVGRADVLCTLLVLLTLLLYRAAAASCAPRALRAAALAAALAAAGGATLAKELGLTVRPEAGQSPRTKGKWLHRLNASGAPCRSSGCCPCSTPRRTARTCSARAACRAGWRSAPPPVLNGHVSSQPPY